MAQELDLLELAAAWWSEGRRVALATVVATWGPSPCPLGSQLLVDDAGWFMGSVSGGCIEGEVVRRARKVIETGAPELLEFGMANEDVWSLGLSCGGRIEVFVEPVDRRKSSVLSSILGAKSAKLPVALLTQLSTGEQIVVGAASVPEEAGFDPAAIMRSRELLAAERNERFDSASGPVFIQAFNTPCQLILVGARAHRAVIGTPRQSRG